MRCPRCGADFYGEAGASWRSRGLRLCGRCLSRSGYGRRFDIRDAAYRVLQQREELDVVAADYGLKPESLHKKIRKHRDAMDTAWDLLRVYAQRRHGWSPRQIREVEIYQGRKPMSERQMRRRLGQYAHLDLEAIERILEALRK